MKLKVFSVLVLMAWGADAALVTGARGKVLVDAEGNALAGRGDFMSQLNGLGEGPNRWTNGQVRDFFDMSAADRVAYLNDHPGLAGVDYGLLGPTAHQLEGGRRALAVITARREKVQRAVEFARKIKAGKQQRDEQLARAAAEGLSDLKNKNEMLSHELSDEAVRRMREQEQAKERRSFLLANKLTNAQIKAENNRKELAEKRKELAEKLTNAQKKAENNRKELAEKRKELAEKRKRLALEREQTSLESQIHHLASQLHAANVDEQAVDQQAVDQQAVIDAKMMKLKGRLELIKERMNEWSSDSVESNDN